MLAIGKVRDREDAIANTRDTCATRTRIREAIRDGGAVHHAQWTSACRCGDLLIRPGAIRRRRRWRNARRFAQPTGIVARFLRSPTNNQPDIRYHAVAEWPSWHSLAVPLSRRRHKSRHRALSRSFLPSPPERS